MGPRRCCLLAGLASALVGPAARATEADVARPAAPDRRDRPPVVLGLLADAGVPDGANAAIALRAAPWLRLHAGGGYNTVSSGVRAGAAWIPWTVGPSLNMEVGHYRRGNANDLVSDMVGTSRWLTPLFEEFGYTYVNTQLGLELGRGSVQFFIHGGLSYLYTTIHNANRALEQLSLIHI